MFKDLNLIDTKTAISPEVAMVPLSVVKTPFQVHVCEGKNCCMLHCLHIERDSVTYCI